MATAISVLILVVIVRVVIVTLGQTERSVGAVARRAESDQARSYLEADLQSLFVDGDQKGTVKLQPPASGWGTEDWESVPNDSKPDIANFSTDADVSESMLDERWGKEGVQLAWFVQDPMKASNDPGGLKAVGYQISRKQLHADGFPRYYLMRSEVSGSETLLNGYQLNDSAYDQGSFSEDAFWAPSVIRHANKHHIIASNVIDFGVRAFERNLTTGQWVGVFPNSSGIISRVNKPLLWIVMLRVLSDEGAESIENIEQGRSQEDWWETAERYSEVVSFRVYTM